jgi:hypothetical protein
MHRKHLYLSILISIVGCKSDEQNKKSLFQFQPDPGAVYQFAVKTVSSSVSSFGISGDTVVFHFTMKPKHVDSTGSRVFMVIQELRLAKQPFKTYDSSLNARTVKHKDEFADMMVNFLADRRRILEGVAGDSLLLFINKHGDLVMADGLDQLVKHVSQKTGIDETQVKGVAREFLSAAALKDMLTGFMFYLPAKHIHQKDTWVKNTMLTALAPVKHSNMISVDTILNDLVFLKIKSRISAGGEGNTYMDGTRDGMVKAALSSGIPLSARFTDQTITRTSGGEIKTTKHTELSCITR